MPKVVQRICLIVLGVAAIPLAGLVVARLGFHILMPDMTRDVSAIAHLPPLAGFLSTLGILLWWTSASIYFFAACLLRNKVPGDVYGFLIYSGSLSGYLGLDDQFQIHEQLAPQYLMLPELGVYALLGLATAVYLWRYRRLLFSVEALLLALALIFLAASVAVDAVLAPWLWRLKDWEFFVEDGSKWLGICFWAAFCILRCTNYLKLSLPEKSR